MANSWHIEWLKEGVQRWNRRRKRVPFEPDLSGANFFELLPQDFRDDPKTSRYFEKIDLSDANLEGSDLSRLNFYKAKFDRANLLNADLTRSNFSQSTFRKTDLSDVSFEYSILDDTEFDETILDGVSFENVEVGKILAISTSLSDVQREQLAAQSIREYASKAEFKSEMRLQRVAMADTLSVPKSKPEPLPSKNAYEVFFGTTRDGQPGPSQTVSVSTKQPASMICL